MVISSISYNPSYIPNTRELPSFSLINQANNGIHNQALDDKVQKHQQQQETERLKDRDREVKLHEQAHLAAASGIAVSGPHFSYTSGPDGQRYATGGDVSIDTSEVPGDPQATLRKAEIIRRAAMAPAQPSGQDYRVASQATAMANKARMELFSARQNQSSLGSRLDIKT